MVHNLYWSMSTPNTKDTEVIMKIVQQTMTAVLIAVLMYVGTGVAQLNGTVVQLNTEMSAIKERLNRLEPEMVTKRELDMRMDMLEARFKEVKDDKVRTK